VKIHQHIISLEIKKMLSRTHTCPSKFGYRQKVRTFVSSGSHDRSSPLWSFIHKCSFNLRPLNATPYHSDVRHQMIDPFASDRGSSLSSISVSSIRFSLYIAELRGQSVLFDIETVAVRHVLYSSRTFIVNSDPPK
jgi:hypothetical protein